MTKKVQIGVTLVNIRGANSTKIDHIINQSKFMNNDQHIICLTETNMSSRSGSIASLRHGNNIQHHITISKNGEYHRTAILAKRDIKIKVVDQIEVEQPRISVCKKTKDPRSVFATLYEIIIKGVKFALVCAYLVPDINNTAMTKFINWVNSIDGYEYKVLCGDLNKNHRSENVRKTFYSKFTDLKNKIKNITRSSTKIIRGKQIKSGTIIDVVMTNKKIKVINQKTVEISRKPDYGQCQLLFDHKMVNCSIIIKKINQNWSEVRTVHTKRKRNLLDQKQCQEVKQNLMNREFKTPTEFFTEIIRQFNEHVPIKPSKRITINDSAYGIKQDKNVRKLENKLKFLIKKTGYKSRKSRKAERLLKNAKKKIKEKFALQNAQISVNKHNIHQITKQILNGRTSSPPEQTLNFENADQSQALNLISEFFQHRANLISESEHQSAKFYLDNWDSAREIKPWFYEDQAIVWEPIEKMSDFINIGKNNGDTNTITGHHVQQIWDVIQFQLNSMLINNEIQEYTTTDTKTTLSVIPKGVRKITRPQEARPIGTGNELLSKYLIAKPAFKLIREKLKPHLEENLNFSLSGTQKATIAISNEINNLAWKGKKVMAIFLDYSNAFFCINRKETIEFARRIGINEKTVTFLNQFINRPMKQVTCQIRGENGLVLNSKEFEIKNGVPAGHCGAETCFILCMEKIMNSIKAIKYLDDSTVLLHGETDEELEIKANKLLKLLKTRSAEMKLKLNQDKTRVVTFNAEINAKNIGIEEKNVVSSGIFIGFHWSKVKKSGKEIFSLKPTVNNVINRLKKQYPKAIAIKRLTSMNQIGLEARILLAKNHCLSQLCELPVVIGLNSNCRPIEDWEPIMEVADAVKEYYRIVRCCLGLKYTTPRSIIDCLIGFSVQKFISDQNSLLVKSMFNDEIMGRNHTVKNRGQITSWFAGSTKIFNERPECERRKIKEWSKDEVKNMLKNQRKKVATQSHEERLKLAQKFAHSYKKKPKIPKSTGSKM